MIKRNTNRLYNLFLLLALLLLGLPSWSQDCGENVINEAQKNYNIGLFENIQPTLQPCINKGFNENQRIQAFRLISVSYLALDSIDKAVYYANLLLNIKPDFDAELFGPPKFVEIINELQQEGAGTQIVSVSKRAENLYEAPATVMIITNEDIINRGYIDLEQLFDDLPGFDVSRTFGPTYSNIYQRGYRSDNTDRTLFLVDGVEENDLWSNISYWSRQFPISNVKRIEVLYGPASTMYGANALVGVVNVITKDPDELVGKNNFGIKMNNGIGSNQTRFVDLTIAYQKKNISFSTTVKRFHSVEEDLSGYNEFNYDPADYDTVDYKAFLSINSNSDEAAKFVRDNQIDENNAFFNINTDANGDTVSVTLTNEGDEAARNYDKKAISNGLNGEPIQYANVSDHWYINGKLKISDVQLGYELWRTESANANYFSDNKSASANNGNVWSPKQSFFYMKFDKNLSDKLTLMNFAQYRITEVCDRTKDISLYNYSNKNLSATHLLSNFEPYWKTTYYYQISRQFRNELKLIYNPTAKIKMVGGLEVRNSAIQGDYRKVAYVDDNKVYPTESESTSIADSSVIEIGGSEGDKIVGGNSFTVYDIGAYVQATWKFKNIYSLTLGGRYDYNRIRTSGGYGSQFNPRVALVATPGKFIFKAIYASAFQNASNWKKYSTSVSRALTNPTLQPEKVSNIDLSVAHRFSKNIYADIVYYNSRFSGVVGTGTVKLPDGSTTGQNQAIGALKIQGFQSTLSVKLNTYSFYLNLTNTYPQNNILKDGELTNTYQRVGDIASFRMNSGVNALYFEHLNVNLRMNYVGKRPVGSETSVTQNPGDFPAYVLFNSAVTYKDILPGLSVQLTVNNLFNSEYFHPGIRSADGDVYSYRSPQTRRNFLIQIIYNF